MNIIIKWPHHVLTHLQDGGWYRGRNVYHDITPLPGLVLFEKAANVLSEFKGLHLGSCGPGVDFARSDINFNPNAAEHIITDLLNSEKIIGDKLYPLGEAHNGHLYVIIDQSGRIYIMNDQMDYFAPSFPCALEKLLCGVNQCSESLLV
jgi:hypothetical protein